MAARDAENKAREAEPPRRHVYGPRPVGALVPALLRPAFRRRSPATALVLADWEAIVGPRLATETTPRKLFAGTLTIACGGPVAMELQHLQQHLMDRINQHFGKIVVSRLRFVQDAPARRPWPRPGRRSPTCRRARCAKPSNRSGASS